jgi:hypothetical protein
LNFAEKTGEEIVFLCLIYMNEGEELIYRPIDEREDLMSRPMTTYLGPSQAQAQTEPKPRPFLPVLPRLLKYDLLPPLPVPKG